MCKVVKFCNKSVYQIVFKIKEFWLSLLDPLTEKSQCTFPKRTFMLARSASTLQVRDTDKNTPSDKTNAKWLKTKTHMERNQIPGVSLKFSSIHILQSWQLDHNQHYTHYCIDLWSSKGSQKFINNKSTSIENVMVKHQTIQTVTKAFLSHKMKNGLGVDPLVRYQQNSTKTTERHCQISN